MSANKHVPAMFKCDTELEMLFFLLREIKAAFESHNWWNTGAFGSRRSWWETQVTLGQMHSPGKGFRIGVKPFGSDDEPECCFYISIVEGETDHVDETISLQYCIQHLGTAPAGMKRWGKGSHHKYSHVIYAAEHIYKYMADLEYYHRKAADLVLKSHEIGIRNVLDQLEPGDVSVFVTQLADAVFKSPRPRNKGDVQKLLEECLVGDRAF